LNLQKKGLHFEINEPSGEENDPTATLNLKDGRVVDLYYEEYEGKEGVEEKTPLLHLTYDKLAAGGRVKYVPKPDPEQEEAIRRWLSKSFYLDPKKSKKELVNLRKSSVEGKYIPYRNNGKVIWAKVMNGGVLVKGTRDKVSFGTKIMVKSDIAKVTGLGRDGVVARTEDGKKCQVLYKDLNLWVRR